MQRHGWQATGLETDERAAAFAGKKYGLKIATRELAAANFDEPFDVITFWHVLEHVFDPVRTLETARKILKGDGVILVACPNLASRDAHFYGSDWVALDAPRHLSHFVPDTMANASTRSGLMVFRSQPMLFDTFYNCLMSEQIIAARTGNKSLPIPFPWVRALTLGGLSWTVSSFDSNKGSAILYYLKKRVN